MTHLLRLTLLPSPTSAQYWCPFRQRPWKLYLLMVFTSNSGNCGCYKCPHSSSKQFPFLRYVWCPLRSHALLPHGDQLLCNCYYCSDWHIYDALRGQWLSHHASHSPVNLCPSSNANGSLQSPINIILMENYRAVNSHKQENIKRYYWRLKLSESFWQSHNPVKFSVNHKCAVN